MATTSSGGSCRLVAEVVAAWERRIIRADLTRDSRSSPHWAYKHIGKTLQFSVGTALLFLRDACTGRGEQLFQVDPFFGEKPVHGLARCGIDVGA